MIVTRRTVALAVVFLLVGSGLPGVVVAGAATPTVFDTSEEFDTTGRFDTTSAGAFDDPAGAADHTEATPDGGTSAAETNGISGFLVVLAFAGLVVVLWRVRRQ